MKKIRQSHHKQGFTLLELLVVIAIIAILVAVGVASYSTARRRGTDAQSRSNIKAIQDGFEQFYADNGTYDGVCSAGTAYFPSGLPAHGSCTSTASTYCVCSEPLEDSTQGNSGAACATGATTHYCLTNLQ